MPSTTFGDEYGSVNYVPEDIEKFLRWWFRKGDIVNATFIVERENKKRVITDGGDLEDVIADLRSDDFKNILHEDAVNAYFTTSASNKAYVNDAHNRADVNAFKALRGVFADVDVKNGVFGSQDDVKAWIETLEHKPGAIVWTGSGGAHLYWKVKGINDLTTSEVGKRWWSYIDTTTPEGVVIDRLTDVETRILRIPGTTRFPKAKESVKIAPVTVEYTDAPALSLETFKKLTDAGLDEYNARIRRTKAAVSDLNVELGDVAGRGKWDSLIVLTMIDEITNEAYTWDEILEPAGWSFYRRGSQGRREWSRPGKVGKAAVTDWDESPHVMSMFSWSEETGLAELYEAEVPLSKWRVLLKLHFNDDVKKAIEAVVEKDKANA